MLCEKDVLIIWIKLIRNYKVWQTQGFKRKSTNTKFFCVFHLLLKFFSDENITCPSFFFVRGNTMLNWAKTSVGPSYIDRFFSNAAKIHQWSVTTIFWIFLGQSSAAEFVFLAFSINTTILFSAKPQHVWTSKFFCEHTWFSFFLFYGAASSGKKFSVLFAVKSSVHSLEHSRFQSNGFLEKKGIQFFPWQRSRKGVGIHFKFLKFFVVTKLLRKL